MVKHISKDDTLKNDISKDDTSKNATSKAQDPFKTEMNEWRLRLVECWNFFKSRFMQPLVFDTYLTNQNVIVLNGQLLRFCLARHLTAETILQMSKNQKPIEAFQYSRLDPQGYYDGDSTNIPNILKVLLLKIFPKLDEAMLGLQKGNFDKARQDFMSLVEIFLKTDKFGGLDGAINDHGCHVERVGY